MLKLNSYQIVVSLLNILRCHANNSSSMQGRVVGGNYGAIDQFPHAVCLIICCGSFDDEYWLCGASVLTHRILLTAAHCVYGCPRRSSSIEAIAGSANIDKGFASIMVQNNKIHEKYDPEEVLHDIALSKLEHALPLGRRIQRVIIRSWFPKSEEGVVAGWGKINKNGDTTPYLKWVRQYVWRASDCRRVDRATPGIMCASSGNSAHYPYGGDSGSAFITNYFQQIGLVSYQVRERLEVIFYTNVSYYYNWLRENSLVLYCDKSK